MTTTKQIFTGDPSQLNAAYKDIAQHVTRLEDKLHQLTATSQRHHEASLRGGQAIQNALKNQILTVVSLTGAWNAAEQAVAAVNRQMEFHERLTAKAKGTQLTVAQSQAGVVTAFSSATSAERASILKQGLAIQRQARFPDINALNEALAAAGSAGATPQEATAAVAAAARLAQHKPGDLREFTGSAFDIGKASGIQDPRRNLGFLLGVGEAARVEGLENTFRNIAPAVISGRATVPGQDPVQASKEIGAFFSAASQMTGDRRGDRTETFTTQFAVQLRDFFTEGREVSGPGGRKLRIKPPSDPGTFGGRIAALQADPAMGRQFLEKANFLQAYKISAEQALQSGSQFSGFQREAAAKIGFSSAKFEEIARDLGKLTTELQLANKTAATAGTAQQFEAGQTRQGREQLVRDVVRDTYEKTGGAARIPSFLMPDQNLGTPPGVGLMLAKKFYEFIAPSAFEPTAIRASLFAAGEMGAEPEATGIGLLKLRQQQILSKRRTMFGFARGPGDLSASERGSTTSWPSRSRPCETLLTSNWMSAASSSKSCGSGSRRPVRPPTPNPGGTANDEFCDRSVRVHQPVAGLQPADAEARARSAARLVRRHVLADGQAGRAGADRKRGRCGQHRAGRGPDPCLRAARGCGPGRRPLGRPGPARHPGRGARRAAGGSRRVQDAAGNRRRVGDEPGIRAGAVDDRADRPDGLLVSGRYA